MPLLSLRTRAALALAACVPLGCTDVLDRAPDKEIVALSTKAPAPETDEVPTHEIALTHADGAMAPLGQAREARLHPRGALVVDAEARLLLVENGVSRTLLESVEGRPALLADGRVVASRSTDPGESDLWLVTLDGAPPRALTATPGADGQPFVLEDGRVLFVSDRTGIVALYIVDPASGETTQLTNLGERPGALSERFVPTPLREPWQEGSRVLYDAGDGIWAVDIRTGKAERVKP